MEKVRLGVVGLGGIFRVRHSKALAEIPEARIAAVADVDEEVARSTGEQYGCPWTTDYREVVAHDSVGAVMVCTPPFIHEEVAVAAAKARKHVFCEKPLAPTTSACDAIIKAAADAGVKLMVAENWLFDPLVFYLKECVSDGRFGQLRHVRLMQAWSGPDRARFYDSPVVGRNGVFLEDGIHLLAMSRALLGTPQTISAVARTVLPMRAVAEGEVPSRVEDDMAVTLTFENATSVTEATWLVDAGGLNCEFLFERATIAVLNMGWDCMHTIAVVKEGGRVSTLSLPDFKARTPVSEDSYVNENTAFVRCVLDDTPSPYPGEEGREDVRLVELAYRSAQTGTTLDAED